MSKARGPFGTMEVEMKRYLVLLVVVGFGCLFLLPIQATVQASPVFVDQFSVTKNGGLLFVDPFSDGVPPPSAPNFTNGAAASYFVDGTPNETGGKVRLNAVGAAITPGIGIAQDFVIERALLLTNIDPLSLTLGLKSVDTFSARGLFDLTVPTQLREFYGIRFNDGTLTNTADDLLHVGVFRGSDGIDRVQFFRLDQVANTSTFFGSGFVLDAGHDQILFDLTRASTSSNAITASFAYVDGGVVGSFTTFATTADIFHGENFTRAEFLFFGPVAVPEPSSLLLLGYGLAGMAGIAGWRNYRRR